MLSSVGFSGIISEIVGHHFVMFSLEFDLTVYSLFGFNSVLLELDV